MEHKTKPDSTGKKQEKRDENGRFIKGASGNMNGRPKGSKNFQTEMEEAIEAYAELNNLTSADVKLRLYMKGLGEGLKGEYNFYRDFMDRMHGRAKDSINLGGEITLNIAKEIADKYINETP